MKKWLRCICLMAGITFVLSRTNAAAETVSFHNGLSLQGYTGVLNTPSAHVTEEAWLYALYTNQEESKWREKTPFQDNYLFSVGLFNFIELGGRLFEAPKAGRDLSANVKITSAPLTRDYPLVPVIAAGIQDLSGGAALIQTSYLVISEDIWRLRLSAGYGRGPDRMKGVFAGGEFKVHDTLYLLGEYDTKETNVGARVVLPQFWKVPISFTATAKTSLDYKPGNFDFAFGFNMPLDFKTRTKNAGTRSEELGIRSEELGIRNEDLGIRSEDLRTRNEDLRIRNEVRGTDLKPGTSNLEPAVNLEPRTSNLEPRTSNLEPRTSNLEPRTSNLEPASPNLSLLRDRLITAGFMNVRVGDAHDGIAVVEYENVIFNHNEMDALGVITGMAAEALKGTKFVSLRIIIKKKNIGMMQLSMPITAAANYLATGEDLDTLKEETVVRNRVHSVEDIDFVGGDENSSFLSTSFLLWPGLSTIIGAAENGEDLFEHRLSLKPDLYVNLWKGGLLNARWDIPVSWSDKMDDGKMDSTMDRLMLFQGIKLLPGVMANLGAGMLVHDLYGTMNELVWQPGDGSHRIRIAQTWGENSTSKRDMESYLASYRYYFSPLDLSLEGTAGKFWSQDRGFSIELKRFFGDTAFSVFYKNSTTSDSRKWTAGGMQIAFPLTPERDMKHYYKMQLRGTDEWTYAQESTFKNKNRNDGRGELNYIPDVPLAVAPIFTGSLHNQYLNRDRLSESYIMSHLERLREAWVKYKDKLP